MYGISHYSLFDYINLINKSYGWYQYLQLFKTKIEDRRSNSFESTMIKDHTLACSQCYDENRQQVINISNFS